MVVKEVVSERHGYRLNLGIQTDSGIKTRIVATPGYYCNGDLKAETLLLTPHYSTGGNHKIMWEQLEARMETLLKQYPEVARTVKKCKRILNPHTSPEDVYQLGVIKFHLSDAVGVFNETGGAVGPKFIKQLLTAPQYVRVGFIPVAIWVNTNTNVAGMYMRLVQLKLENGPYPGTDIMLYDSDCSFNMGDDGYTTSENLTPLSPT